MRKICVLGLGYVGLPLAVELSKKYDVVGFDISQGRVNDLKNNIDKTLEVNSENLKSCNVNFSCDEESLKGSDFYIVTVPTPINESKIPDLYPIKAASRLIAKYLKKDDIVVYESTVFPGCTEEVCVPLLEQGSNLKYNEDFYCGYSPERMNPGDKNKTVKDIVKVTAGSTPEVAKLVDEVYASIVTAGTHLASSIRVAEAAKVIENSQRDINIAFVNELSIIFNKLGLDTAEVLEAAGTKWNFLKFSPGLVGGHCIGVDPYYLTYKAKQVGYNPEVILSGRRINDDMGSYVASEAIKMMIKKDLKIKESKALVVGVTFKENCPDYRNTKVVDIVHELTEYGLNVDCFDPHVDGSDFKHEYGLDIVNDFKKIDMSQYNCIVFAVAHKEFKDIDFNLNLDKQVVYDLKGIFPKDQSDGRL
ncbi:MAG: nucleotide sugar dehydrogenase [Bacteriovoracaceae bacterium]|jgi:UDP-N-acetyl-D-galactosamine dehydrogenase|nr:nucleotide sugar dehydrogenase [Bacteriovoracaceae bacterium]